MSGYCSFEYSLQKQREEMIKQNLTPADPTDDDVLCGSGRVVLEHPGNIRFQRLVEQKYDEYLETADSKVAKTRLTTETLREVVSTGGRFLKKHAIYDLWYVCSKQKKVGRDKISHLLRQMARRSGPLLPVQAPVQEENMQIYGRQQEDQNDREAEETRPLDPGFQQDGQRFTGVHARALSLSPHIQMLASQQHQYLDNHMPASGNQELWSAGIWNGSRMRNSIVLCSDFHVRTIEEMRVNSSPVNYGQQEEPTFPSSKSLIDEMFPGARTERTSLNIGTLKANLHNDGECEHERGSGSGLPSRQISASLSSSTLPNMEQV